LWFQIISQGLSLKSIRVDNGEQVADSEGQYGVDKWKHLLDILTGYTREKSK